MIPENAKPYETAILLVYYGMRVQDPVEIANILHYKTAHSVYRVLKRHRLYCAGGHSQEK